jgi:hypothetical protein
MVEQDAQKLLPGWEMLASSSVPNQRQKGQDIDPYTPLWKQIIQWMTKSGTVGEATRPSAVPVEKGKSPRLGDILTPSPGVKKQIEEGLPGKAAAGAVNAFWDKFTEVFTNVNWQPFGVGLVLLLLFFMGVWGLLSGAGVGK